jgi:hypothetical protein
VSRNRRRGKRAVLAAILVAAAALAVAPAAIACNANGYTYAGLASASTTHGVAARLTAIGAAAVADGHVAGWVGVGGPGEGPNGTDEWVQVGFSGFAGSPNSDLYYEVTRAGASPRYFEVEHDLPPGTTRRVAVLEVAGHPNAWRVWVNGKAVSAPIYLPRSHGAWRGVATAESWTSGGEAACNGFGYRFDDIRIAQAPGGAWALLSDPLTIRTGVNELLRPGQASFEAISGRAIAQRPRAYVAGPMMRTLLRAG